MKKLIKKLKKIKLPVKKRGNKNNIWRKIKVKILKEEGLQDWKIKIIHSGGGLCLINKKEIWLDKKYESDLPMFLHEISHAITKRKHDGVFADKFTELVRKYMK